MPDNLPSREEEIEDLREEAAQLMRRLAATSYALGLLGHTMTCGKSKTQNAAYEELLDSVADLSLSWNANRECSGQNISVEMLKPDDEQ